MRRLVICMVAIAMVAGLSWATGDAEEVEPVTLEIVSNPEYEESEKQIWELYTQDNPHVTINVTTLNEPQMAAYLARIAGGDVPAIELDQHPKPDKDTYTTFVDLNQIDFPYWDLITGVDHEEEWRRALGVDYIPGLIWKGGRYFSFIYYEEEMAEAGLSPREDVRSIEDLDSFLAQLKTYVDNSEFDYVWDIGWHSWVIMEQLLPALANALGGTLDEQEALFRGEIDWLDKGANPFVPALEKLREWHQLGYFPERWWTRDWQGEYEAGFVGMKSIFTFHGPWLWTKVEAENPGHELNGFPLPTGNGVVVGLPVELQGSGIFAENEGKPFFDEIVEAFIWGHAPEQIKLRVEAQGLYATYDLSSVGGLQLDNPQARKVALPITDGFFGDLTMDFSFHVRERMAGLEVSGKPNVLNDNDLAPVIGQYVSGEMSLDALLQLLKARWEEKYGPNL